MLKNTLKRFVVSVAGISLLSTTLLGMANAAMVGTQAAISASERAEYVSEVKQWMTEKAVQEELVAMGVDQDAASERVDAMTNEELRALHGRIDQLPAGAGVVEVVGIVFIVLIILELVGVTNVFSAL